MSDGQPSTPDTAATAVAPSPPRPRRGRGRPALLGLGVLAAVVVAGLAVRAVTSPTGGAGSPEVAVSALVAAMEAEDPLAALGTVAPDEVEALDPIYELVASQAEGLGFAPPSGSLVGLDVTTDLAYEVEGLGPELARVRVRGDIRLSAETDALGEETASAIEREAAIDGEDVGPRVAVDLTDEDLVVVDEDGADVRPFLVTVRREGRWYVSPLSTLAQYAVETLGLASPTPTTSAPSAGAEDPEAAVEELLIATGDADATAAGDLVAGAAGEVIRTYPEAMAGLIGRRGEDPSISLETLETEVDDREEGGVRVTVTRMEATLTTTDDQGEEAVATIAWDGRCLSVTEDEAEDRIGAPSAERCLTEGWRRVGLEDLSVVVVEEAGGWQVDPLATLTDRAEALVAGVTADDVLRVLGLTEGAEPTAQLRPGTATQVELNEAGYAVVAMELDRAEGIAVSTHLDPAVDDELMAHLVSPDGVRLTDLSLVEPQRTGRYLLVVSRRGFGPGRVTVRASPVVRRGLPVGEVASGEVSGPGDIVEYSVELDRGTDYALMLDGPDLTPTVLDPDGRPLAVGDGGPGGPGGPGEATFAAEVSGPHTVQVDAGLDGTGGAFRVGVRPVAPFLLGNGTSTEAEGTLGSSGDGALIDLTVQGGRAVAVNVMPATATLDPVLIVEDPESGDVLRRLDQDGPGRPEAVTFTPDETTTYRVVVEGSDRTAGVFHLDAALVGPG